MGKDKKKENGTGRRGSLRGRAGTLREFSSGGVVFKREGDNILWLVRATVPNELFKDKRWTLPKGWIDDSDQVGVPGPMASGTVKADEESLQKAALREVWEEGATRARIVKKIGSAKYFFNLPGTGNILKFVTFYLMEYLKDNPDGHDYETSEIVWLPFNEAYKKLSYSGEKKVLKKAKVMLDTGLQETLV